MDMTRLQNSFEVYANETEKLNSIILDDIFNFIVTPYFIPVFIFCFTLYSIVMHKKGARAYHVLDTTLILALIVAYFMLLSVAVFIQKPFMTAEGDFKTEVFLTYFNDPEVEIAAVTRSLGGTQKEHKMNTQLYHEYGIYMDVDGDERLDPVYVKKTNKFAEGTILHVDFVNYYQGVVDWSSIDPMVYMYQAVDGLDRIVPLKDVHYIYVVAP